MQPIRSKGQDSNLYLHLRGWRSAIKLPKRGGWGRNFTSDLRDMPGAL